MIITIHGKKGEGKTSLAKKICNGKKHCIIEESFLKSPFWGNEIDLNAEVLIIDEVKNYNETFSFFNTDVLIINRQLKKPLNLKTPDVILIVNLI